MLTTDFDKNCKFMEEIAQIRENMEQFGCKHGNKHVIKEKKGLQ